MVTPNDAPETKFVPVMVTAVPPAVVPESGVMLVNVGGVRVTLMNVVFVNVLDPPRLDSVRFTE